MDNIQFTDEEIEKQLHALGYFNVSEARMKQFRKDLHKLIENDRSTSGSSSWFTGVSSPSSGSDFSSDQQEPKPQVPRSTRPSSFQPHLKMTGSPAKKSRNSSPPSWMSKSTLPSTIVLSDESPTNLHHHRDLPSYDIDDSTTQSDSAVRRPPSPGRAMSPRTVVARPRPASPRRTPSPRHPHNLSSVTEETTSSDASSSSAGRLIQKRKVLRKQVDGTPRVFDESLMDGGRGVYRNHDVSLDDMGVCRDCEPRVELPPRPHSARPPSVKPYQCCQAFVAKDQLPSFIRPSTTHPHTRNLQKVDPVNKYHQYKEIWANTQAPGEKAHKALRWETKAQMMYKEEPAPRPQRVYVPNTYVVPTSKKRSALRWEVRHAMERGLPIPTVCDRVY